MKPFPFHALLEWSHLYGRTHLPWRQYFSLKIKDLSYHIWLSEILLQQTQADRVIGYYEKILARFPTIESLAESSYETFFPYYQGLGYYSRARNMLKCAQKVVESYDGVFPNDTKKLIGLPGVGPYTAAAIRAFAYNEPVLSFDTNLEKIFARYYHGSRFLKLSEEEKKQIEEDFRQTKIGGREINAACMDFGSGVSLNNKPAQESDWLQLQENYPFKDCLWIQTFGEKEIVSKKEKVVFPTKDAKIIVVLHENHKIYYSENRDSYEPLTLPPTENNVRHTVQKYFREKYSLEVSVRPVHEKYFKNDAPFMVCNAQIQSGKTDFFRYRKENGNFIKTEYT